jgi:hypothetical protein
MFRDCWEFVQIVSKPFKVCFFLTLDLATLGHALGQVRYRQVSSRKDVSYEFRFCYVSLKCL